MANPDNTCFFTGHRFIPVSKHEDFKSMIKKTASHLIEKHNVTDFITGGALGFDTLAAYSILDLKEEYPHIKLHLYLPCTDQAKKWSKADIDAWNDILNRADSHRFVFNHTYVSGCMQQRNRAMADASMHLIAYCVRSNSGSYMTVSYAKEKGCKIIMINP